jgi:hypothetical protein
MNKGQKDMSKIERVAHISAQSRTFYLVLQGEFALYREPACDPDDDDTLHIMAPEVLCHKYLAGPWLTDWCQAPELPMVMTLENVVGDRKRGGRHFPRSTPEQNVDIVPNLGPLPAGVRIPVLGSPPGLRLDILAPMPIAIIPGLVQTANGVCIEEKDSNGNPVCTPETPFPTVIPILVYKWFPDVDCEDSRPFLSAEDSGMRIYSSGPSGSRSAFQSLQVYATSPYQGDEENHSADAFTAAAALLGIGASLKVKDNTPRSVPLYASPPAGLSFAQINWCLYEFWGARQDDPRLITDYDPGPPPVPPLPPLLSTGGGSHNCGPVTGG